MLGRVTIDCRIRTHVLAVRIQSFVNLLPESVDCSVSSLTVYDRHGDIENAQEAVGRVFLARGIAVLSPLEPLINAEVRQRRALKCRKSNSCNFMDLLAQGALVTEPFVVSREELNRAWSKELLESPTAREPFTCPERRIPCRLESIIMHFTDGDVRQVYITF